MMICHLMAVIIMLDITYDFILPMDLSPLLICIVVLKDATFILNKEPNLKKIGKF